MFYLTTIIYDIKRIRSMMEKEQEQDFSIGVL